MPEIHERALKEKEMLKFSTKIPKDRWIPPPPPPLPPNWGKHICISAFLVQLPVWYHRWKLPNLDKQEYQEWSDHIRNSATALHFYSHINKSVCWDKINKMDEKSLIWAVEYENREKNIRNMSKKSTTSDLSWRMGAAVKRWDRERRAYFNRNMKRNELKNAK